LTILQCERCGANLEVTHGSNIATCVYCGASKKLHQEVNLSLGAKDMPNDIVFARWPHDGYYYPANIGEIHEHHVQALFLDGETDVVKKEHVVTLQEAFDTFAFEGNWHLRGGFFKGKLSSQQPLIMNYDDGDVEKLGMNQLRGARPGEKAQWIPAKSGCFSVITVLAIATIILIMAAA